MAKRHLPILTTPSPGTFSGFFPLGQKHAAPEIQQPFTPGENMQRFDPILLYLLPNALLVLH